MSDERTYRVLEDWVDDRRESTDRASGGAASREGERSEPSERADGRWLLLDPSTGERAAVAATGYDGELAAAVAALEPGNRVRAALDWSTDPPRFAALDRETATRFRFVRTDEPLFEAARDCWAAAERAGEAMNVEVTYSTDNEANGVVYVFADGPDRDRLAEFRDGRRPLDPLVERVERVDPPYEVFVVDPRGEPFVVVYVVFDPEGLLAETVRDSYYA